MSEKAKTMATLAVSVASLAMLVLVTLAAGK